LPVVGHRLRAADEGQTSGETLARQLLEVPIP
jgi:hypothetical protein